VSINIATVFLTLALDGGEWSGSRLSRFTSGERTSGPHSIGCWEGGQSWPGRCGAEKNLLFNLQKKIGNERITTTQDEVQLHIAIL
jgi:hypothetical protein